MVSLDEQMDLGQDPSHCGRFQAWPVCKGILLAAATAVAAVSALAAIYLITSYCCAITVDARRISVFLGSLRHNKDLAQGCGAVSVVMMVLSACAGGIAEMLGTDHRAWICPLLFIFWTVALASLVLGVVACS